MINSAVRFVKFERKSENRTFNDSISIDINRLDAFPKDCELFLNDNFEFRTPLIQAFHDIKRKVFHVSPHPDNVIVGYNGWNFIAQQELEIFTGKLNFTRKELKKYQSVWKHRLQFLDSLNIPSTWVICPMKHYVYGEHLPFNFKYNSDESRVDKLSKFLSKDFPQLIINPKYELIKEKNKGEKVYFQNDNHWNHKAGEIVTELIIKKLKKQFPSKNIKLPTNYYWLDTLKEGGIHKDFLGIETPMYEFNQVPIFRNENGILSDPYDLEVTANFPYPEDFQKRYVQQKPTNDLKVLIIRDSFGDYTIPFLKEVFAETVFIFDNWQYGLNEEIILKLKPDIVIFLGLETHIRNIIK